MTNALQRDPAKAMPRMNLGSVTYSVETGVTIDEFRAVLNGSGLGARRPVDDAERLGAMLANANLIVTARIDGELVGIARAMTDFSFSCYLSDLAVIDTVKGRGIGKALIDMLRRHLGPTVNLILSAVPEAVPFYERIGMAALHDCFWYRRERWIRVPRGRASLLARWPLCAIAQGGASREHGISRGARRRKSDRTGRHRDFAIHEQLFDPSGHCRDVLLGGTAFELDLDADVTGARGAVDRRDATQHHQATFHRPEQCLHQAFGRLFTHEETNRHHLGLRPIRGRTRTRREQCRRQGNRCKMSHRIPPFRLCARSGSKPRPA
ncbi:GNAT family N-acetyltransferase [Pseudoduganella chitinolytica]|uniref:GNAT family N-acetyltransferase n=1 Tax=Pseudoduganella chitinolytica TaxID=34070 RepID=A0ABY8BD61_9BURK|nr:GNAT family N-acetyltransferase [Pseudoduganella chitinolytica]WEF33856.1 GNAT family N-acetyltransferase [Pseudoduganella chitinolytica]